MSASDLVAALRRAAPSDEAIRGALAALLATRLAGDAPRAEVALAALAELLDRLAAAADLAGRVTVRLAVRGPRPDRFAAEAPATPEGFRERLLDLGRLDDAAALARAAEEVDRTYGGVRPGPGRRPVHPRGLVFAHAVDEAVAERVRAELARGVAEGREVRRTGEVVAALAGWARGYADTVARTHLASAYAAGRHREAEALLAEGAEVGFELQTAGDADVRPNHAAADGLRARADDAAWEHLSPPLGQRCRCNLVPLVGGPWTPNPLAWAAARGARPDGPGFGRRPDRATYG